jgi:hypothetical protein
MLSNFFSTPEKILPSQLNETSYYHADLNETTAYEFLKNKPYGSFLFRPSSQQDKLTFSVIYIKDNQPKVVHCRFILLDDGTLQQPNNQGEILAEYESIPTFLRSFATRNNLALQPLDNATRDSSPQIFSGG